MFEESTFLQRLAEICSEAASLILEFAAHPSDPDVEPIPQWADERHVWVESRGTAEPMDWVAETTSTYLVEAAHQVRATRLLLLGETVTVALDPLVRASIERAGRVKWLLDPNIDLEQRGARAGLEFGVSLQAYRMALERLRAPSGTRNEVQNWVRAHRDRLEELFTVVRPPSDPCDPDSAPSPEISTWTVASEQYPNYRVISQYALENESTKRNQAAAWYDGLSGFSHPSVVFSREHRAISDSGMMTYTYRYDDIEKAARVAVLGMLDAARYWTTYYGADPDAFQHHVDVLSDRMDEISVIPAGPEVEQP